MIVMKKIKRKSDYYKFKDKYNKLMENKIILKFNIHPNIING